MLAIEAKSQAEKESLSGIRTEAVVGKIAEFIGFEIQNGEGLLFAGTVSPIATVEEDGEAAIGRNSGGSRKIIDLAGGTGNCAEKLGIWQLCGFRVSLRAK